MNVRGMEIEVVPSAPEAAGVEMVVAEPSWEGTPDERGVRSACAAAIDSARAMGAASLAMPAMGIAAGMSPVTSGKIMVQEAIRVARSGSPGLRRMALCCPDARSYQVFARTVNGYLKHFLEVLIWGPFVTVDAIIEIPAGIVLVKRSNPPLGYALPGGFVDYGESLEDAVRREAREETGLELRRLEQLHTYSAPGRDPRFHTVTTVFTARADGNPRAGDDAAEVRVVRPEDIDGLPFAFDHLEVLRDWLAGRVP